MLYTIIIEIMATIELENNEPSKETKGYILSSFILIIVFIGVSLIGYFLNLIDIFILTALFLLFFILTIIIILYSKHLETVSVEKLGHKFRKYSHLAGGVIMILFCIYSEKMLAWISFTFFIIFCLHEFFYVKMKIYSIFTKALIFIGRLERNRDELEYDSRPFYPTLLVLAAISIIGFLGQMVAIAAVIAFALGDSFSTIVGEKWGRHKLPYNKTKSVEGTLIFFATSFLGIFITYLVAGQLAWIPALIAGFVGCSIESFIPKKFWLDDNFAVPVSVGLVLYIVEII
ncbi:MAG: diacylglycerol/polyprenol kinase family protein [Promethearchaeota archaeon]